MFRRKQANSLTYLSATSEFQGNLNVEGNLRVDGIVHGTIEVRGDMEISQSGLIEGVELRANNIIVHGVIKARVIAEGRLTLSRTARLEGDVTAQSIDVEAGAFYIGHISTTDVKALPVASPKYPELIGREEKVNGESPIPPVKFG
ncbi:MAG: polymer-forming cytoskeletal protein [Cyanobacteria bacterium CRU_2_1]|nr:polymer-forming cytoskeletal protein [Cyanobacteria bacterium RU_5_0]NJR60695.1 polymer-forming cytoskeletal protein [Cyanobacteria bacterium CRU_2_1]